MVPVIIVTGIAIAAFAIMTITRYGFLIFLYAKLIARVLSL